MTYKPTVLVDFDGVIHRYSKGWQDGSVYDPPMPGAHEALNTLVVYGYTVVIFSTRRMEQIRSWLKIHGFPDYRITNIKEPAVCIIDDRAIRFESWSQALGQVAKLYPIKK